jgi:hypothetical protein
MKLKLRDYPWRTFYGPSDDRLKDFYLPALSCSIRYERSAGYFTSTSLAVAATGIAHLIRNGGRMRLLVGARLVEADVKAVEEGYDLRERIEAGLLHDLIDPADYLTRERLKALAWMIARGTLDIRVVLPVDRAGKPVCSGPHDPYYHIKTGVFTDEAGDQVAFTGSVNDSETAWIMNYEDLAVYTSWITLNGDTRVHLKGVVDRFEKLWNDQESYWKALPIPQAVLDRLISYAPAEAPTADPEEQKAKPPHAEKDKKDQDERILFQFVKDVPHLPTSRGIGLATTTFRPWPHQTRVADAVISRYPEGFLLCDEVGLGKSIEAGLILRQLVLDGRVSRAMIMTPKSITRQFQEELDEKFVLDVPVFDGKVFHYRDDHEEFPSTPNPWDSKDLFIVSSQLAKRRDRRDEILSARPFDLIIADEAHHARRREFTNLDQFRPNNLLRLLTELREKERVRCLLLMTATPLQVHPVEIFDLLRLLGLGGRWGAHHSNFLNFFSELRKILPTEIDWPFVLSMVDDAQEMGVRLPDAFGKAAQDQVGPVEWHRVRSLPGSAEAASLFSSLTNEGKVLAREMVRNLTPIKAMIQRSTRDLLRKYHEKGILKESICRRDPKPVWIPFTLDEERLYADIEVYISDFYRRYEAKRAGLGFVMTIYRRRLTSSFRALERSLERRLNFLKGLRIDPGWDDDDTEQDDLDFDFGEEIQETTASVYEQEIEFVEDFLNRIRSLPADSKLEQLFGELKDILKQRETVLVFTQYTDTMDYLRDHLRDIYGTQVACYSGRGGELWDGTVWKRVPKEEIKKLFLGGGDIKILLGTEAMSEGLNLQTCGVLINFDMPWNPMRVEQRIGRIDRIGQKHGVVWIRNYFYEDSIEALVYRRLENRIDWFETVVGHLQPILSQVGKAIEDLSMTSPTLRGTAVDAKIRELEERIQEEEISGLKLDEYLEMEVEAEREIPLPVSPAELELLFVKSSTIGRIFKPHPAIQGAFLVGHNGDDIAVTFLPELFDKYPDTLRFLTYGDPLLMELLSRVPAPSESDDGSGRLIRCKANGHEIVGYFCKAETGVHSLTGLESVHRSIGAEPAAITEEQIKMAESLLRDQSSLLQTQDRNVRESLAVGDYLARKEEARILLRRSIFVDRTRYIMNQPELFDTKDSNKYEGPIPSSIREFARSKGFPYAPLLVLLGNEDIAISLTDAYLLSLSGRTEKSLRGLEQWLRESATDVLKRLAAARDRLSTVRNQSFDVEVEATIFK